MTYQSVFDDPDEGVVLNCTESAKYLKMSPRKFRRIALGPTIMLERVYPYWAKRILDCLPVEDDFSVTDVHSRGKAVGEQFLQALWDDGDVEILQGELRTVHSKMTSGGRDFAAAVTVLGAGRILPLLLTDNQLQLSFRFAREAQVFCEGALAALNSYLRTLSAK